MPDHQAPEDYKQIIGQLFRDRLHRMPADRQLSEETVNSAYGTAFRQGMYRVVIICLDVSGTSEQTEEAIRRTDAALRALFDRLETVCMEELPLMTAQLQRQWVLNYMPERDPQILSMLDQAAGQLAGERPAGLTVTFCCSGACGKIQELRKRLNEASDLKWSRFAEKLPLLLFDHETPCPPEMETLYASLERQMLAACATLDLPIFQDRLEQLFSLSDRMVCHSRTRTLIRRVEAYMFDINREIIASFTNVEEASRQMEASLQSASSLEDYKRLYTAHMRDLFTRILQAVRSQGTRPVYLAQVFVRTHLAEPIHLAEVAAYVGLNPSYLSYLFRKETGIGLPDYINHRRVEEAKKLLEQTDEKVLSIARAVGFSDPRYFSRVFRALAGCRPKDYRKARQWGRELSE